MKSSWQHGTGHLAQRWTEVGQRVAYDPRWFEGAAAVHGTYLPAVPDFASHSPFGGGTWFQPFVSYPDFE